MNKLLSVALGQEDPQLLPIEIYLSVWYPKTIQQNISVWLWHSKIGLVKYRFVLDCQCLSYLEKGHDQESLVFPNENCGPGLQVEDHKYGSLKEFQKVIKLGV